MKFQPWNNMVIILIAYLRKKNMSCLTKKKSYLLEREKSLHLVAKPLKS